jgi:hypothetical protein
MSRTAPEPPACSVEQSTDQVLGGFTENESEALL